MTDDEQEPETVKVPPRKRGFAAMTPEKRRELSSRGGKASHATGKAHRFTTEEAKAAGRKGGLAGKGVSKRRKRAA